MTLFKKTIATIAAAAAIVTTLSADVSANNFKAELKPMFPGIKPVFQPPQIVPLPTCPHGFHKTYSDANTFVCGVKGTQDTLAMHLTYANATDCKFNYWNVGPQLHVSQNKTVRWVCRHN